jgi:hypothetical protein
MFTPLHLERMTSAIGETAAQAAFYFAGIQLPEPKGGGRLWEAIGFRPRAHFHLINDARPWVLFKNQPTMLQSSVISRQALEIVGSLDESRSVCEDSYLFCQVGIGGRACAVSGIGCVQTADDMFWVKADLHGLSRKQVSALTRLFGLQLPLTIYLDPQ